MHVFSALDSSSDSICKHKIWPELPYSALTLLVRRQEGHLTCKNWVVRYWRGYLSRARCKWFAYGPADATATHRLLLQWNPEWFTFLVPAYPGCPGKKAVKQMCVCVQYRKTLQYVVVSPVQPSARFAVWVISVLLAYLLSANMPSHRCHESYCCWSCPAHHTRFPISWARRE